MTPRLRYYKLVGRQAFPCTALEFVEMRRQQYRVALDAIGEVSISTVFLFLDHNCSGKGPPLLFETMVFGGRFGEHQQRYSTWEEAVAGHKRWCYLVKETMECQNDP